MLISIHIQKMELQVVSHHRVAGNRTRSSTRAASVSNHGALSLASRSLHFILHFNQAEVQETKRFISFGNDEL